MRDDVKFKMVVEDVFSVTGIGTCVKAKIEKGAIGVGDKVEWKRPDGTTRTAKIKMIVKGKDAVSNAREGDEVGIMLSSVRCTDIKRNECLVIR